MKIFNHSAFSGVEERETRFTPKHYRLSFGKNYFLGLMGLQPKQAQKSQMRTKRKSASVQEKA
jgi:hypothetical protein